MENSRNPTRTTRELWEEAVEAMPMMTMTRTTTIMTSRWKRSWLASPTSTQYSVLAAVRTMMTMTTMRITLRMLMIRMAKDLTRTTTMMINPLIAPPLEIKTPASNYKRATLLSLSNSTKSS